MRRNKLDCCLWIIVFTLIVFVYITYFGSVDGDTDSNEASFSMSEENDKIAHSKLHAKAQVEKKELAYEMDDSKEVVIFAATTFVGQPISTQRFMRHCKTQGKCRVTSDRKELATADAVVYHNSEIRQLESHHSPSQVHVLWSLESPTNHPWHIEAGRINWTMYYTRDADVYYPYGHIRKLASSIEYDLDSLWSSKTSGKTAVWLASNCHTNNHRKPLLDQMVRQGLELDIFGACGRPVPKNCDGLSKQGESCVRELVSEYKFYMSFENSNCRDYITEKFWMALYDRMVIPLVMHRHIYEDAGIPGSSFIALDDFPSTQDFVDHVNALAVDKTKYLEHHQWRNEYEALPEMDDDTGYCELCRKLRRPRGNKSYDSPTPGEWQQNGACDNEKIKKYLLA